MIEEKIWLCVESLKEEDCYQDYLEASHALEQHAELLYEYKHQKEKFLEMKAYEKYQDLSSLRQQVLSLGKEVEALTDYQRYHQAKNALDVRLQALSDLIFDGLVQTNGGGNCAGHCGEI